MTKRFDSPDSGAGQPLEPVPERSTQVDGLGLAPTQTRVDDAQVVSRGHASTTPQVLPGLTHSPITAQTLGKYELLEELEHGGMGVVYKARDTVLDRFVALKVLRSGTLAQRGEVLRFLQEARAAAQFTHPHIVPILEIGQEGDQHYFTMPFAVGGSLACVQERFREDPRAAVEIVQKVARAVHCVHAKGILHRDLKPANVLLNEAGEPWVADFGLAKFCDTDLELTLPGQRLGTLPYMSPEQVDVDSEKITERTDVWALGVLLYHLLTDRRPFPGRSEQDLVQAIRSADPLPLRALAPRIDRTLEAIILKCLEKNPAVRFASAEQFADELQRWLNGEPTHTRPPSLPRRLARTAQRHVVLSLSGFLLLLVAPILFLMRPEDPELALIRQMAKVDEVVWAADSGPAPYARWSLGFGDLDPVANEKYLSVRSDEYGLLRIATGLPWSHYRFSAEVRQEDIVAGECGIYFLHHRHETLTAVRHFLLQIVFIDRLPDPQPPQNRDTLAQVTFDLVTYSEPRDALPWRYQRPIAETIHFPSAPAFQPGASRSAPWHKLAVEVAPETITLFWDDVPPASVTREQLVNHLRRMRRIKPELADVDVESAFGQSLGHTVRQGHALYRQVRLQRLKDE